MAAKKKSSGRRYGKKAGEAVERAMHERKAGTLRSGRSGKKVTSKKQAIAIGLSEARAAGGKVPEPRKKGSTKKRSASSKKTSAPSAKTRSIGGAKKRSSKKRSTKKASSSS